VSPDTAVFVSSTSRTALTMWEFLHGDRSTVRNGGGFRGPELSVPLRKSPKGGFKMPQIIEMAEAGSGIDLISRALS
jgi:hypothetical protein